MTSETKAFLWFAVALAECCLLIPIGWGPPLLAFGVFLTGAQFGKLAQRIDDAEKKA